MSKREVVKNRGGKSLIGGMLTCDELWSCMLTYEEVWFGNEDIW